MDAPRYDCHGMTEQIIAGTHRRFAEAVA